MLDLEKLNPKEIVFELDKYIVGQDKAKRAVAVALRNRIRRRKLPAELIDEVYPKNIIMIGSTGVGKTEIARRISKLSGTPFLKVEATKYTEVGYVGRDVESIIRDLMTYAVNMVKKETQEQHREECVKRAEDTLLEIILNGAKRDSSDPSFEIFRNKLRSGELDNREVEIEVKSSKSGLPVEIFSGSQFDEINFSLGNMGDIFSGMKKGKKRKINIKKALEILTQDEMEKITDIDSVSEIAKYRVENMGIVFIDEIDKIVSRRNSSQSGAEVSREGVQRDLLPIIEGSKVNTKYGIIDTSHILFIAAGAFQTSSPSDLIPELQGRFPIKVELEELNEEDFFRILKEPENSLIKQYVELLKTEGVSLIFDDESIRELAKISMEINSKSENIGARRLHTVMELLLEEVSFNASEIKGQSINMTRTYIREKLNEAMKNQDLNKYVL